MFKSRIREERETLKQIAERRKQQKNDEKLQAKEKKKEEKRVMAEYAKVKVNLKSVLNL
jgi:hypothetical protein